MNGPYQITVGAGDLYCFRKTLRPSGDWAAYEMAIAPGPKTYVTRYPRSPSPTRSFFAIARASERDGLGRLRHAGRELLERIAEVRLVARLLLECLLRREALVLDHLPLRLVDLAQAVVHFEVRREDAEDDAVRHDDVGDILERAALRLGDTHRLAEGRVGEHDHDTRGFAPVAPPGRFLRLRALRGRLHRRELVERIEERLRLVATALGAQAAELRLQRHGITDEGVVLVPVAIVLGVAEADDLGAPVLHRGGVVRVGTAELVDEDLDVPSQRVDDRCHAAADGDEEDDVGDALGLRARLWRRCGWGDLRLIVLGFRRRADLRTGLGSRLDLEVGRGGRGQLGGGLTGDRCLRLHCRVSWRRRRDPRRGRGGGMLRLFHDLLRKAGDGPMVLRARGI